MLWCSLISRLLFNQFGFGGSIFAPPADRVFHCVTSLPNEAAVKTKATAKASVSVPKAMAIAVLLFANLAGSHFYELKDLGSNLRVIKQLLVDNPSGIFDFVLPGLRQLKPCDPRTDYDYNFLMMIIIL